MKSPLVLQKFRIHGLGEVIDGPWLEVGKTITFFQLPEDFNSRGFLHTLQSINPPESLIDSGIFQNYPPIIRQGKYQKRVRSEKRTVAFGIFIAQPDFVGELGSITPHLYEADRVEVGRRLNYSRWVNFIEIASSTRWSEVDEQIIDLIEKYPSSLNANLRAEIIRLKKTDRITDSLMELLARWLQWLKLEASHELSDQLEELIIVVNRQNDFRAAKKLVRERLPYFCFIEKRDGFQEVSNLLLSEKQRRNSTSILLIDEHSFQLTPKEKDKLRQNAAELSESCQILYLLADKSSSLPANSRVVTLADLMV